MTSKVLTPSDLTAMEKIALKKAEIKKLETAHSLKEKTENTFRKYEKHADDTNAVLVQIGAKYVRIKKTEKQSVAWAKLAKENISEAELDALKPNFNSQSVTYKAEPKAREALAGTLTRIPKVA